MNWMNRVKKSIENTFPMIAKGETPSRHSFTHLYPPVRRKDRVNQIISGMSMYLPSLRANKPLQNSHIKRTGLAPYDSASAKSYLFGNLRGTNMHTASYRANINIKNMNTPPDASEIMFRQRWAEENKAWNSPEAVAGRNRFDAMRGRAMMKEQEEMDQAWLRDLESEQLAKQKAAENAAYKDNVAQLRAADPGNATGVFNMTGSRKVG